MLVAAVVIGAQPAVFQTAPVQLDMLDSVPQPVTQGRKEPPPCGAKQLPPILQPELQMSHAHVSGFIVNPFVHVTLPHPQTSSTLPTIALPKLAQIFPPALSSQPNPGFSYDVANVNTAPPPLLKLATMQLPGRIASV